MTRGAGPILLAAGGVGLLLLAASGSAPARVAPPRASTPEPPSTARPNVRSGFGWRTDPITGRAAFHRGIDIPAPVGTPVYAPWPGVVERIDRDGVGGGVNNGNAVFIRVNGSLWAFLHLSAVLVHSGAEVQRGQLLGRTGATGRATGPHLHVQVYDAAGKLVDPLSVYPSANFTRRSA